MKPPVDTIITDLDNTLYDWFKFWYASFGEMLRVLVEESGISAEEMKPEIRALHHKYGTSEYSALIQELPCLQKKFPGEDLPKRFGNAIEAYRRARKATLELYPTVLETLCELKSRRVKIIGYTDSRAYQSAYRVRRLGLDGVLDYLYSPPDHKLPPHTTPESMRTRPPEEYKFKVTQHRHTPEGESKPNPHLLLTIIAGVGATPERTVYVGDSLMKDITMAQQAGIFDVYAEYGVVEDKAAYTLLQEVSHWPQTAVDREKVLTTAQVSPTYVLHGNFAELLALFDFRPH